MDSLLEKILIAGVPSLLSVFVLLVAWRLNGKLEELKGTHAKELEVFKSRTAASLKYLESHLSRRLHVDSIRFEKEFEVYQELWAALQELSGTAHILLAIMVPSSQKPEMGPEALSKFREALRVLQSTLIKNSPFLSKEVFISASNLMLSDVVKDLSLSGPDCFPVVNTPDTRSEDWKAICQDTDQIIKDIQDIWEVIRKRIERWPEEDSRIAWE